MPPSNIPGDLEDTTLSPSVADATPSVASPEVTPDANPQSSSGTADDSQTDDKEPETMAEAIERALNADSNPAAQADPADAENPDGSDGEADPDATTQNPKPEANATPDGELPEDPTEDELKAYKPNVRKRIDKLLEQRATTRQELEQVKPDAANYRAIRQFMSDRNLVDAEVADLFKAGADLKAGTEEGFRAFLERVTPLVQMAQEALGQAIPQDLQPQVDAGEMTDNAARELARQRQAAALANARADQLTAANQQQQTQRQTQQMVNTIANWTQQKRATDPDFAAKQDVMRRVVQGLVAERGHPKTPQEAVQYSEDAHAEATRLLLAGRPTKAQTRPTPTANASPNRSGIASAPTSLDEIVQAGLAHRG